MYCVFLLSGLEDVEWCFGDCLCMLLGVFKVIVFLMFGCKVLVLLVG